MLSSWGQIVYRRRRVIVTLAVAFLLFAVVWGTGVFAHMTGNSSVTDAGSESQRIGERIEAELGPQGTDFIGLYSNDDLDVDDPAFKDAVEKMATSLRASDGVEAVTTYYDTGSDAMRSTDGHETFVAVRLLDDADDDAIKDVPEAMVAGSPLTTQVGGSEAVDLSIQEQVPADIARAETIAMPLLLIALLLVFGSVVAASMPLLIGTFAVLGAFTLLRVIAMFTEVSIFSLNIITILGLGLAIDYGLFVVGRFREELHRGRSVEDAVQRTMETAGRMVVISGVLVTLALSGLLLFPQVLLRSLGMGGAAAVLFAMLASLTVLPAILAMLGHRVDAWRIPWTGRRSAAAVETDAVSGRWASLAHHVMRRPVVYLLASIAVLGVLTYPFSHVRFGGVDERMLPVDAESRLVAEQIVADFPGGNPRPIRVLVSGASPAEAQDVGAEIAAIKGVDSVDQAAQSGRSTLFSVGYSGDASSAAALDVVRDVRALSPPGDSQILVGGSSAEVVDQLQSLSGRMLWMALLVAGITFLVLAIGFRSLVVPLKAIVVNVLSIGAAFGVVTWIFQDGHLAGWLNFTPTGYIEASQPVLMVAILFGLSMDYEVFLLSRIRETWLETGDNTAAVSIGLQRSGPIITVAALLMCIVIGFFSMSSITFLKMIGVGMVVAILVDATIVRLVLVPVTMRLLGRANWWLPGGTRRHPGHHVADDATGHVPEPSPTHDGRHPARVDLA
ncbi:MMPL family transporter [Nocardioides sp. GXZ039]|uniref:MMPL family transporter n=1 Tax=Nocardioides sp. GXZ039 TaxID=3136018 RepID=UPI0030F44E7C